MQWGKWQIGELTIIGLVVLVQGFGSALAKAAWDANWGLLAVAERWFGVPTWLGLIVGVVGVTMVVIGLRRTARA